MIVNVTDAPSELGFLQKTSVTRDTGPQWRRLLSLRFPTHSRNRLELYFNLPNADSSNFQFKSKNISSYYVLVSISSLQLQRSCQTMSFQFGVVQAFWSSFGWSLCGLSTRHNRTALSFLQGGILPRSDQADHPQKSMQTWVPVLAFFENV